MSMLPPLVGRLVGDNSDFVEKMQQSATIAANQTGAIERNAAGAATRTGSALSGMGRMAIGAGAALAGAGLASKLTEAGDAARTFNDVVSGAASGVKVSIDAVSTAANSFTFVPPTVAAAALRDLGQIQAGYGKTGQAALDNAKRHLEVAQAMSVVMGLPVENITEGIAAAYRGEFDSLQRLIPSISAATVEAEALSMTKKKQAKELTAAEKAQATENIIMREGGRYLQQLGDNTDTAAAKQRKATADTERARIELGNNMLPVMAKVSETVSKVANVFASLPDGVQTGVIALIAVVAVAGPMISLMTGISTLMAGPVVASIGAATLAALPWIAAIGAVVAAGYLLYRNWDTIVGFLKGIVSGAFNFLKQHFDLISMVVLGPIAPLLLLARHWDQVWGGMKAIASGVAGSIAGIAKALWNGVTAPMRGFVNWWNNLKITLPKVHIPGTNVDVGGQTINTPNLPTPPQLQAGGTVTRGGMVDVGEAGRERLYLPPGAEVRPLRSGSGAPTSGGTTIVIQLQGGTFIGGSREQAAQDLAGPMRDALVAAGFRQALGLT